MIQAAILIGFSFQARAEDLDSDDSESLVELDCDFEQADFESMILQDRIAELQAYYLDQDVNFELLVTEGKTAEPPGTEDPSISVDTLLQLVDPKKDSIPPVIPNIVPVKKPKSTKTKTCKKPVTKKN